MRLTPNVLTGIVLTTLMISAGLAAARVDPESDRPVPTDSTTPAKQSEKAEPEGTEPAEAHPLGSLHAEAEAMRPLVRSAMAKAMLDEVKNLPVIEPRTLYVATRPNRAFDQAAYDAMAEEERKKLRKLEVTPERYYSTFYGTPVVYARVLDLAAEVWGKSDTSVEAAIQETGRGQGEKAIAPSLKGKRILDLGYGQLGQLRLWAQMGAAVTGVEVDPILTAMYEGCAAATGDGTAGSIRLLECGWPNDADCLAKVGTGVGTGYDLFVARNLFKRGFVKPEKLPPGFPEPVGWGMTDEQMLGHLFEVMSPGGVVVVYSIGPAPDPAKPWSDIANPWPRAAWGAAGFEVIAHDADESAVARKIGSALGWEGQMDLEKDLFGVYSMYRRPGK